MMKRRPVVVVLAAGRGARFEGPGHKLEQTLGPDAEPLLASTLRHAIETRLRVMVVSTESLAPLVLNQVAACDTVILPNHDSLMSGLGKPRAVGMGHSIAAGVSAAGDANGWLIVPGDMPLLQPASILAVAAALEHYPVAYAQYLGRRGHPVGFSAELYSELVELQGDEGARRLVARYPNIAVDLDDPGVLVDIDNRADLARVRAQRRALLDNVAKG
ncbi:MAG TPA: nucleotidyltransferase family protein [Burkholderiaceae bacterium]|jgi:molybdenum cofactor cytidylyltransferase